LIKAFISLLIFINISIANNILPVFNIYKNKNTNNNLVIIGEIHGDESSGYLTAFYLTKNLKIKNSNYNIYIIPFTNINGIINNKRSIKYDFNNKFTKRINKRDIDYHYVTSLKNILDNLKPKIVVSIHAGHKYTVGNSIIIDEKKYKNIKLYNFILPVYLKLKKQINCKLVISNTIKNRYKYGQDNFNDLSWFCLTNYNSYFYTIESTKEQKIIKQIKFLLLFFQNLFDKLNIKSNINVINNENLIKKQFKIKDKDYIFLTLLKNKFPDNNNHNTVNIIKASFPILNVKKEIYYYDLQLNKILRY